MVIEKQIITPNFTHFCISLTKSRGLKKHVREKLSTTRDLYTHKENNCFDPKILFCFICKNKLTINKIISVRYTLCTYTRFSSQGLGASEKKNKQKNYIILQGGELTCSHFFKSSC